MVGNLVAKECNESKHLKFNARQEKIGWIEGLEFWAQKEHDTTKDDYQKFSRIMRKYLLVVNVFSFDFPHNPQ